MIRKSSIIFIVLSYWIIDKTNIVGKTRFKSLFDSVIGIFFCNGIVHRNQEATLIATQ